MMACGGAGGLSVTLVTLENITELLGDLSQWLCPLSGACFVKFSLSISQSESLAEI